MSLKPPPTKASNPLKVMLPLSVLSASLTIQLLAKSAAFNVSVLPPVLSIDKAVVKAPAWLIVTLPVAVQHAIPDSYQVVPPLVFILPFNITVFEPVLSVAINSTSPPAPPC